MLIVFIAGISSGVVRMGTLGLRAIFAFAMTSAASYFLMMLWDLYDEKTRPKPEPVEEEPPEEVAPVEEVPEVPPQEPAPPPVPNFQPMNANELPKA